MNRTPSFIVSVCFVAAVIALAPAGGSGADDTPPAECGEAHATAPPSATTAPCRP